MIYIYILRYANSRKQVLQNRNSLKVQRKWGEEGNGSFNDGGVTHNGGSRCINRGIYTSANYDSLTL